MGKKRFGIKQVILGTVLSENYTKWLPFALMFTVFGLFMISVRFRGEKVLKEIVVLQDSVRDLRFESVTLEAELMKMSRYSSIRNQCEERNLGLVPPSDPPKKLKAD